MRSEIIFAGSGGQGIITASIILAEAAALHEGRYVVQSQSYGPEARGGSSSSNVIIDDQVIGYPKAGQPQFMICLTQEALDKFASKIRPGGLMITDAFYARKLTQLDARVYNLPLFTTVKERVGLAITFNVAVLGALVGLTKVVRKESLVEVLKSRIAPQHLEKNLKAFDVGLELATSARPWRSDLGNTQNTAMHLEGDATALNGARVQVKPAAEAR